MTTPDPDDVAAALRDALADVAARYNLGMVGPYVVVMDVIESDGKRARWATASPNQEAFETMGLLWEQFTREQAAIIRGADAGDT